MHQFLVTICMLPLLACRSYAEDSGSRSAGPTGETGPSDAACAEFTADHPDAAVANEAIDETSGLGFGRINKDTLWVHNDSGDTARIFAIGTDGTHHATVHLTGTEAQDWEDLALVDGASSDEGLIYIGDIGDNGSTRKSVVVYRLAEPDLSSVEPGTELHTKSFERFELVYEDGAHNAEALMVDPRTGRVLILTKTEKGVTALYATAAPLEKTGSETLHLEATIDLLGIDLKGFRIVTAADISPDGGWMLVRTYSDAYMWARPGHATYAEWLETTPCELPVEAERQGEAATFSADARHYFTISEGIQPEIYRFRQTKK